MREHTDLRVRRTHAALRDALIALIPEKGFDAVTVGDITERAMVNRATFYRHYQDKYDLVASIFKDAVDTLISELGHPPDDLDAVCRSLTEFSAIARPDSACSVNHELQSSFEAWVKFFEHFARHTRLYQAMLGRRGSTWFTAQMVSYLADGFTKRSQASKLWPPKKSRDAIPSDVGAVCMANWLVGILTWWLESGTGYSPRQVAIWSHSLMFRGIHYAMGFDVGNATDIPGQSLADGAGQIKDRVQDQATVVTLKIS